MSSGRVSCEGWLIDLPMRAEKLQGGGLRKLARMLSALVGSIELLVIKAAVAGIPHIDGLRWESNRLVVVGSALGSSGRAGLYYVTYEQYRAGVRTNAHDGVVDGDRIGTTIYHGTPD